MEPIFHPVRHPPDLRDRSALDRSGVPVWQDQPGELVAELRRIGHELAALRQELAQYCQRLPPPGFR